jgi:transcriptional regulator with XRE-family HTH domain
LCKAQKSNFFAGLFHYNGPVDKSAETVAIGKRLRAFRETLRISRSSFALAIGYGSERIASYEAARAPLPYSVFVAIADKFDIDPFWFATGNGEERSKLRFHYPSPAQLKLPEKVSFFEAFSKHLFPALQSGSFDAKSETVLRYKLIKTFPKQAVLWLHLVPDGHVGEFDSALQKWWKDFYATLPPENPLNKLRREAAFRQFESALEEQLRADPGYLLDFPLTVNSLKSKTDAGMKTEIQRLIERVNRKASRPGAKAALAKQLRVAPARISEWLAGEKEPGGDYTLRLLRWVEQQ